MFFLQRAPQPPLSAFVDSIWLCRNDPQPHALERILPSGSAQLIVNLKEDQTRLYDPVQPDRCTTTAGTILSGVHSRYQIIDTSEQEYVAGVAFKAGGLVPFMRLPAHETCDVDIPAEDLWGRGQTEDLRDRVLESASPEAALDALETALLEMWTARGLHRAVAFALTMFDRAPRTASIADVVDACGMSAKRFIERFKSRSRRDAEALLPHSALPARSGPRASRPRRRLGAGRAGQRVLRPGALHPRLPRVLRPDADRLSGRPDAVPEPRQISTIR